MILAADLIVYANKLIKLSYDKGICDIDYFIAFKFTMLIGVNVCICVYLNKLSPLPCGLIIKKNYKFQFHYTYEVMV